MNPWDQRYEGEDYFYGKESNDFLSSQAYRINVGGKVLCLAEGEGRNAVFLAKKRFEVTAVDSSRQGLEKLHRLAREQKVTVSTVQSDLGDFEIEEQSWDAIVSIWCHLPKLLREKVHQNCMRGLKKRGLFILEAYRPQQLEFKTGGPPTAELMMNLQELKKEFSGFEFLVGHEIERMVHEGKGHQGQSAVVQVVARKG